MILWEMGIQIVLQGTVFGFQFYSISNIKSLSLKQQFYLPGFIPLTKSTSEIPNHASGFPSRFPRTCFQFPLWLIIVSMIVMILFPVLNV